MRRSGVLCHPTSFPGPYGIGELGEPARRFVDWLVRAGQSIWQVLPLGPTGYGDSPYQPFSAFAGNPLLISLDALAADGLLTADELRQDAPLPADHVDFGAVIELKDRLLRQAWARLPEHPSLRTELEVWAATQPWLEDYCLFMALKREHNWAAWTSWPSDIALRQPAAVAAWRARLDEQVGFQRFMQFAFDRQWRALHAYAHNEKITIMGDVPIFVGHDSADVWSHRELFYLDTAGHPTVVAGVPPDYFSATGQLWGNPLYRWDVLRADGYRWWVERLRATLERVDLVRLDHFRGFGGYWEVPAGEPTAINGRWVRGPGHELFDALRNALGALPLVAEDLGLISQDVIDLRKELGLPGMRVLQFGFGGDASNPHLPHNHEADLVVYTATHDNDTSLGWYTGESPEIQHKVRTYTGSDGEGMHWALIRETVKSVAETAIFPLQDVLGLGSEARLNFPGVPSGNWSWRYRAEQLDGTLADALRELTVLTGRAVAADAAQEDDTPPVIDYASAEPCA
jgi:4-alpha-glucanotransferase